MYISLIFFWLVREIKAILFWLYLWQLKEYHIGRFLDHFRTKKGKTLFLNKIFLLKIILVLSLLYILLILGGRGRFYFFCFLILTILYFLESLKLFYDSFKKKLKKPVFTKKIIFLFLISFSLTIFYLLSLSRVAASLLLKLLVYDILTSFIVSGIVLLFQPLTVLLRYRIIGKAKKKRAKFKDLLVIGITGSYGKTSTKEFLSEILSAKFKVLKTKEHQNSEMGISRCILNNLKKDYEIFIVEMGAYNPGGIKLLSNIAKPKIGILTGINEQHLATFGSQENIIKTKYELIESLPKDGFAVFNGNNSFCQELYLKTKISKEICGTKSAQGRFDIWADDVRTDKRSLSFRVQTREGGRAFFNLNLLGVQNIENILMAAAVARKLKVSLEEISTASQKIKPFQAGITLEKGNYGLNIIKATYSANPNGVVSHLEYLKTWKGRKIIIMPCLIELGSASDMVHTNIGRKIGEVCDKAIITTEDKFKELKKGAVESGMEEENILYIERPEKIIEEIKTFNGKEDIILLEGRLSKELVKRLMSSR